MILDRLQLDLNVTQLHKWRLNCAKHFINLLYKNEDKMMSFNLEESAVYFRRAQSHSPHVDTYEDSQVGRSK